FTPINFPGASLTQPWKISSHGDIVGVYLDTNGVFHGFLFAGDEFSTIDVPGAAGSGAFGINPRGDIVGSYCEALPCSSSLIRNHGFFLSKGQFVTFDFPGAQYTRAFAINPRGDIAGAHRETNGRTHAFLIKHAAVTPADFPR